MRLVGDELEGDIDVRAQSRDSVRDDRLSPKKITAPQDLGEGRQRSRAVGWTGTMEELGQAHVGEEILTPVSGVRPGRDLQERLAAQLLGDAQALQRSEACDAFASVRVLGVARQSRETNSQILRVITAPFVPRVRQFEASDSAAGMTCSASIVQSVCGVRFWTNHCHTISR